MPYRRFSNLGSSNLYNGFSMYALYYGCESENEDDKPIISKITSDNTRLTKEDIKLARSNGNVIIGVGEKVYSLPSDFVDSHPGGAQVLKVSNGYNVENIWKNN